MFEFDKTDNYDNHPVSNRALNISESSLNNYKLTKADLLNNDKETKDLKNFETSFAQTKNTYLELTLSRRDEENAVKKQKNLIVSNYKLAQTLNFEKLKSSQMKDYIKELNEKIESIKYENEAMIFTKYKEDLEKDLLEKSQKQITEYCNNMKKRSNNIESTIRDYENIIQDKRNELNHIKNEYEDFTSKAEEENKILKANKVKLLNQSETLNNKIREMDIACDGLLNEIDADRIIFNEKDLLNKIKYEKLETKVADIQKKAFSFQEEHKKNNLFTNEKPDINKNYKLKKARKLHEMSLNETKEQCIQLDSENEKLSLSIKEKGLYLDELLITLKQLEKKQDKQPSYLRKNKINDNSYITSRKSSPDLKSGKNTRPQTTLS